MIRNSLGFLAGNMLLQQFFYLDLQLFFTVILALLLLTVFLLILGYFSKSCQYKSIFYSWLTTASFFSLSFINSYYQADQLLKNALPQQLENREIIVQGIIDSIPIETEFAYKFNFKVHNIVNSSQNYTIQNYASPNYASPENRQKIRLSWYKKSLAEVYAANVKNSLHKIIKEPGLRVGDFWQFKVKLKRPSGLLNPGTMDYEKWLFSQQIQAVGYIRKDRKNRLMSGLLAQPKDLQYIELSWWEAAYYKLHKLRQNIAERLTNILRDNEFKGIYLALTLGIRDQISDHQWQVFIDSGTNHLIAISGLHIGLIAALGFIIGRFIWSRSESLLMLLPAQMAGALIAVIFAICYAALAGFSIPTQRALIMLALVMGAILFKIRVAPSLLLSYALIIVLLFDPMASLSIGFWLSFAAVAIILYSLSDYSYDVDQTDNVVLDKQNKHITKLKDLVKKTGQLSRLQLIIFIGLLPFGLLFFSRILLLSPLANLIAVPWMSLLIIPLVLFSAMAGIVFCSGTFSQLSTLLFDLISLLMQPLWLLLDYLSQLNSFIIQPNIINMVLISAIVLAFIVFKKTAKRYLLALLIIFLIVLNYLFNPIEKSFFPQLSQGEFKLSVLDVGQGLSAIVQTENHILVYDTGNAVTPRFDMAKQVLIPFFRFRAINKIDTLILSHADNDHIASASSLLSVVKAENILTGEPERLKIKMGLTGEQCLAGQKWSWDQVEFEIINPGRENLDIRQNNNNLSCVVLIKSKSGRRVLLTGDIEEKIEKQLLGQQKLKDIDIVIAPHHGSNSSSGSSFINWLSPKIVIFTNAYLNRYHFPSERVIKRYRQLGSQMYSTQNGLIEVFSKPFNKDIQEVFYLTEYRKDNRRYWNRSYKAIQ